MKLRGLEGVEAGLFELKTATAKAVGRRVLKAAGQPVADAANGGAPLGDGADGDHLSGSYVVGSNLTRRQAAAARKEGRFDVVVHIGTANEAGVQQEFGNINHGAQPHFRPAWDGGSAQVLADIEAGMAVEVEKSAARARRKAARNGG